MIRTGVILLSALLVAACTVGPDYRRPDMTTPASFKEGAPWKPAQPADAGPRGAWWALFADPVLDSLMVRVATANQNVRMAEAQYRQARALSQQARAGLFPTVGASGAATRSKTPSLANRPTLTRAPVNNYDLQLDVSWEIDLWGRVRRTLEAGRATEQAAAADRDSILLAAQAELAQNYFLLRVADLERQLLDDTVAAYARNVELTRNRYAAGVAAKVDVVQAQTQLASTRAQALDLGVQRARLEHAIALLLGEAPATFSLAPAPLAAGLPDIPPGLPSDLLQRRPDVAAAERRMAAANARIGVAAAAWYPSLTLNGASGYRSASLDDLFLAPARFWSLGPTAALTLFDAGLRKAQREQVEAAYDAEVATYRQTVLTGFQEVEDNLAALRILAEEGEAQAQAVASGRESVRLANNRYKAGTASYLDVIAVQAIALNNERNAAAVLGQRLTASVLLVKALGGGWEDKPAAVAERSPR